MFILIPLLTAVVAFGSTEKVLYSFKGGSDGGEPGGMVLDKSGNLYGAAETGGRGGNINCFGNGCGFVYKLAPIAGGGWKKTNLYSFTGKDDGGVPVGNLAIDAKGNLYGVTEQGGTGDCSTVLGAGCGVVFRLSPNSKGKWDYKVIWNFGCLFQPSGSPAVYLFPKATEDPQNALLGRMFAGVSVGYTAGFCRLWFSRPG
jgi:hypothetical protein